MWCLKKCITNGTIVSQYRLVCDTTSRAVLHATKKITLLKIVMINDSSRSQYIQIFEAQFSRTTKDWTIVASKTALLVSSGVIDDSLYWLTIVPLVMHFFKHHIAESVLKNCIGVKKTVKNCKKL